ncbi:MAG: hypothetical protein HZC36_15725 [Armatimonadetes bacterium]|nr:hypothetical protein [Armatimonadota bacterium]
MKLNLLPTYVSKEKSAKAAWFVSAIIALAAVGATYFMIQQSKQAHADARAKVEELQPRAANAAAVAKQADLIMASARGIIVNADLAHAMMDHNNTYADLYAEVERYVPGFFRLNSISATPVDADNCVVTMAGVIRTYEDYADLMLALLRIPGAMTVSRNGYQVSDMYVPPLSEADQRGTPIKVGDTNVPEDPADQIEYFAARAAPQGYLGVGGFGSGTPGLRQSMPGWQDITVSVVLSNRHIQTPDPRATLAASASGGGGSGGGGGTAPGGIPAPGAPPAAGGRPTGGPPNPGGRNAAKGGEGEE